MDSESQFVSKILNLTFHFKLSLLICNSTFHSLNATYLWNWARWTFRLLYPHWIVQAIVRFLNSVIPRFWKIASFLKITSKCLNMSKLQSQWSITMQCSSAKHKNNINKWPRTHLLFYHKITDNGNKYYE